MTATQTPRKAETAADALAAAKARVAKALAALEAPMTESGRNSVHWGHVGTMSYLAEELEAAAAVAAEYRQNA